jgi:hypothetical protein
MREIVIAVARRFRKCDRNRRALEEPDVLWREVASQVRTNLGPLRGGSDGYRVCLWMVQPTLNDPCESWFPCCHVLQLWGT